MPVIPPQLLEDVEDTLSCTTFEEDSLSRKLNCECVTTNTLLCNFLVIQFQDDRIDFLCLSCVVV